MTGSPSYICGCCAREDAERSTPQWKVYFPSCDKHGERLDFATLARKPKAKP